MVVLITLPVVLMLCIFLLFCFFFVIHLLLLRLYRECFIREQPDSPSSIYRYIIQLKAHSEGGCFIFVNWGLLSTCP